MPDYKKDLRLDRRLTRRLGWIPPEELQRELDALPDVSDKVRPPEEDAPDPAGEGSGAGSGPQTVG